MPAPDDTNFPLLTDDGRAMLHFLREHPAAPRFTHPGADRLSAAGLERVRAFEAELGAQPPGWPGARPGWLDAFAAWCQREVPYYRQRSDLTLAFDALPTCTRNDLQRRPWAFVPDSQPLDDLVVYQTSGSTGHPLDVLTHPEALAMYVPLLRAALRGIRLDGGSGRVAAVNVCFQRRTWTYAAISPVLAQAGFVKVNLSPGDWRAPGDRAAYLDACNPQIYTGDPLSFVELMRLPLTTRPKALVSSAMALLDGTRQMLEAHFGCPVVDIYSLNETGPIAVAVDGGFALLHHRLYVEIVRADGTPCDLDERGEITVSGGFSPFLPLLRYRTGDFAAFAMRDGRPMLTGLEGRQPVVFRDTRGNAVNNIDVSHALKPFALAQYQLHQSADGSLRLRVRGAGVDEAALRHALAALFGEAAVITVEEVDDFGAPGDKVVQYVAASN